MIIIFKSYKMENISKSPQTSTLDATNSDKIINEKTFVSKMKVYENLFNDRY